MTVRDRVRALWTREPVARALRAAPPLGRLAAAHGARLLRDAETWDDVELGLTLVAHDRRAVLVVPAWPGTTADEILYWLPFVQWAVRHAELPPERVVVVRPAEHGEWYAPLGATVADVPAGGALLDQSAFLRLCSEFWDGGAIRPVVRHAWYGTLPQRELPELGTYVAVDARVGLASARDAPHPAETLVAGATGAIGPWGDVVALALLHGVPSVLLAEPGVAAHLDAAQRYARLTGTSLTVADRSWLHGQPILAAAGAAPGAAIRVG